MGAYIESIKLIVFAAAVVLCCFITWYATSDHYEKLAAQKQLEQDKASADLIRKKTDLILKGEAQHATDQATINFLAAESGSMQVHIPTHRCGNTKGTADQDRSAGVLSNRVDEAFANLQAGVGRLIQRCDQLNIDAIQLNATTR